jgi:hypothetical protein
MYHEYVRQLHLQCLARSAGAWRPKGWLHARHLGPPPPSLSESATPADGRCAVEGLDLGANVRFTLFNRMSMLRATIACLPTQYLQARALTCPPSPWTSQIVARFWGPNAHTRLSTTSRRLTQVIGNVHFPTRREAQPPKGRQYISCSCCICRSLAARRNLSCNSSSSIRLVIYSL